MNIYIYIILAHKHIAFFLPPNSNIGFKLKILDFDLTNFGIFQTNAEFSLPR